MSQFVRISATIALTLALACGRESGSGPTGMVPRGPPSGPINPAPASLWRPPNGSTPATGSYAYVEMDAGFSPAVVYPHTIVARQDAFTVSVSGERLEVIATDAAGGLVMNGVFQTMIGLTQLKEGYYHDLRGLPQIDPLYGALAVSLNSRACDVISGWFVVDHVFYFNGLLTALDLRFEARCTGFSAPMHGQMHWTESFN